MWEYIRSMQNQIGVLKSAMLNEHVLNKYALRTRFFRESRSVRAGYKRGVVRPEVLCHAHNHGGQIQTLKKKLHKLNAKRTVYCRRNVTDDCQYSVYHG